MPANRILYTLTSRRKTDIHRPGATGTSDLGETGQGPLKLLKIEGDRDRHRDSDRAGHFRVAGEFFMQGHGVLPCAEIAGRSAPASVEIVRGSGTTFQKTEAQPEENQRSGFTCRFPSVPLQRFDVVKQDRLVVLRVYLLVHLADDTTGIDHEGSPFPKLHPFPLGLTNSEGFHEA